mmetsp:Transcript_14447/g.62675  ORF Transcript_14447/g.62675 Transcript_14447/m.62675 type:complete len:206 (-) Transcript_14447:29-646(-)
MTSRNGRTRPRWARRTAPPGLAFWEAARCPDSRRASNPPSLAILPIETPRLWTGRCTPPRKPRAGSSGSHRAASGWTTRGPASSSARSSPTARTPTWAAGSTPPSNRRFTSGTNSRHRAGRRPRARSRTRRGFTSTPAARTRARSSAPSSSSGTTRDTSRWICRFAPRTRRRRCRSFPSPRCWSAAGGTRARGSRRRCARSTRPR